MPPMIASLSHGVQRLSRARPLRRLSRLQVAFAACWLLSACGAPPHTQLATPPARATASTSAALPAPSAAQPVRPLPLPTGNIGAPGPLLLRAASPNGRWVALCQAREDTSGDGVVSVEFGARGEPRGDQLATYLVRGAGFGERVDELIDSDSSGRWLLLQRGASVVLFDDYQGSSLDLSALGADARDDVSRDLPHRAFSFDATGKYLAYLRLGAHKPQTLPGEREQQLVLRELATGVERTINPGSGSVYRLSLSADANWLILQVLIDDTNENGRLDWPLPAAGAGGAKRCVPPVTTFSAYPRRGDQVFTRSIYLGDLKRGGKAQLERHGRLAIPFGSRLLYSATGKRLMLRDYVRGRRRGQLVMDACDAHVLHADAARNSILVACEPTPEEAKETGNYRHPVSLLQLEAQGTARLLAVKATALGFDLAPIRTDEWSGLRGARLIDLYPGEATQLVDLERKQLFPLRVGDIVLHTFGARALVRRGNALWLFQAERGPATPAAPDAQSTQLGRSTTGGEWIDLKRRVDDVALELHQGRYSWVSPQWIDLQAASVLGELPRVLALSDSGMALVPSAVAEARPDGLSSGPLEWVAAGGGGAASSPTPAKAAPGAPGAP